MRLRATASPLKPQHRFPKHQRTEISERPNDMTTSIDRQSLFQPAEAITWRDIRGELIVLQLESGEYFSFNEIGRLVWLQLAEGRSIGRIVEAVLDEYEVSLAQAENDVITFVRGLLANGLLVPQSSQEKTP